MSELLRQALESETESPHPEDAAMAAYLDGVLEGTRREALERHVAGCARCAEELAAAGRVLVEAEADAAVDTAREPRRLPSRGSPAPPRSSRTWLRLAASIALIFGALVLSREAGRLVAARLEPVVVARFEEWTGRPVSLGGTELRLAGGPGVDLTDLRIGDDPAFSDESFLGATRVSLQVEPSALLGGRLSGAVEIDRPTLRLVRNRAGHWNVETLAGKTPGPSPVRHAIRAEVERALADAAAGRGPEAAAEQARVQLTSATIRDGVLEIRDLGREGGTLTLEDVDLAYHGSPTGRASVSLEGQVGSEKDRIALRGEVGPFEGQAVPVYRLREVELEAVPVAEIPGAPKVVAGQLDFDGHLESAGRSLGEIVAAARGGGELGLCCGQLAGRNIARDFIDRLAALPSTGAALATLERDAALRSALSTEYTAYDHLGGLADLEPGTLHLAGLQADTPLFRVDGDASIGLEGHLSAEGSVDLAPELGRVLLAAAPALDGLARDDGALELPFRANGRWESLVLELDVATVLSRLGLDHPPSLFALLRRPPSAGRG